MSVENYCNYSTGPSFYRNDSHSVWFRLISVIDLYEISQTLSIETIPFEIVLGL